MSTWFQAFHPLIARWFGERLGAATEVQSRAWPVIAGGKHVLISAPTGSGKTLTAFLWALDRLVTGSWVAGATRVVYVSPLKALNNDIRRNLLQPLEELREVFGEAGVGFPEIRVQVRSGDTPSSERQRMVRRPPEILITTPESLNLILSSPRARGTLGGVRTVILDEIHAVAGSKRGTHLITAVERVSWLSGEFQRIGLSATVRPLDRIADFIGGYEVAGAGADSGGRGQIQSAGSAGASPSQGSPSDGSFSGGSQSRPVYRKRSVTIVESKAEKRYEMSVRYPPVRADHVDDGSRWPALADEFKKVLARNTATLIFVNTRRHCERISLHLNREEPEIVAYAHHGSLSREMREAVEERLKNGTLKAIVATSSLELGIDIGHLDEVILVQTPYSVSSTLQRLGRAGHRVGEVSRGTLYPIFSHDVLQAAVMIQAVREAAIEPLSPPANPLDVLAQVILSMTAIDTWDLDRLYDVVRGCSPYHTLPRRLFDLVVDMLGGRYAGNRVRALEPLVSVDGIDNSIRARRGALRVLYSSGGTIPDRGYFNLRLRESKAKIGELDEEFVWERRLGETFTLGTQTWKIQEITHNDVLVTPGTMRPQDVPFWKADQITQKHHFSAWVSAFLEMANGSACNGAFVETLMRDHALDREAAEILVDYLGRQRDASGADLPHRHHVLIEFCRDHRRGNEHVQCILHTFWGGSVNRPFAFALAQAFADRHGQGAEVFANNDAVVMALPEGMEHVDPFGLVEPDRIEALLRERLEQTGYFGARFRENAARALLLPKQGFGKRMPLWMTRIRSKSLLDVVAGFEDFPILLETWRTCFHDEFELDTLKSLLGEVHSGAIRTTTVRTSLPTPFASAIVWGETNQYMYADDSPDSPITSKLSDDVLRDAVFAAELRPRVDPNLVAEFQAKAQRLYPGYAPATADELLDWVKERQFIPQSEWVALLAAIERDHGLSAADICTSRISFFQNGAVAEEFLVRSDDFRSRGLVQDASEDGDPLPGWLEQWLRFYGPISVDWLNAALPVAQSRLCMAIDALVEANTVLRGELTAGATAAEVCDAENFEIVLRLARKQARPALTALPIERLGLFLAVHQGLAGDGKRAADLAAAIEPIFGYPLPAELLEGDVLPARIVGYAPAALDGLAADSGLQWAGAGSRCVYVALPEMFSLFIAPDVLDTLDQRAAVENANRILPGPVGRFTFTDLLEHTGKDSATLNSELWDHVWHSHIANDSFQTLRKGISSKFTARKVNTQPREGRRSGFQSWKGTRSFTGNWYRLPRFEGPADLIEEAELIKERARVVLDRYGVVFRQLVQNELPELRWGAIFKALRLMELSGEIASGHFFADVPGLQFASLSALRRLQQPLPDDPVYWVNALDPACVCGIDLAALKGTLPARHKSNHLVFHGARLVLVSHRTGKEIDIGVAPEAPDLPRYLGLFDHLLGRAVLPIKNIDLETINGQAAAGSPYLELFRRQFEVVVGPQSVSVWKSAVSIH